MSITAKFYKISDDPRVINKTLGTEKEKTITIKGADSILNPTITIRYDATMTDYNYVFIPEPYNRYYFLAPPVIAPGKRMTWGCSVDPLMSNKDAIEGLDVIVTRLERGKYADDDNRKNSDYISDNHAVGLVQPNVHTVEAAASPFNTESDWSYVMSVVGGVPNVSPQGGEGE